MAGGKNWLHEALHRLLMCPNVVATSSPQKEQVRRKSKHLLPPVFKQTHCLFSSILFAISESLSTSHSKREWGSVTGISKKTYRYVLKASPLPHLYHLLLPSTYLKSFLSYVSRTIIFYFSVHLTISHLLFPLTYSLSDFLSLNLSPSSFLSLKRERKNATEGFIGKIAET